MTEPAEHDLEESKLLLSQGQTDEAKPLLRNVIALDPTNSLAHAILGDLLGQEGQFDEAAALLRTATELDPDRIGAWHNLTILTKISETDRSLVETMEEMLKRAGRSDFDRALLHFALGKAYDDLGETSRRFVTSTGRTRSSDAGCPSIAPHSRIRSIGLSRPSRRS
jgi:tetratricopeptide (TPR) repeat protein